MRATLILLVLVYAATHVLASQIREFSLKTTELLGRKLYEQSQPSSEALSENYKVARQTAIAALPKLDSSKYKFEVLDDPDRSGFLVYALAGSKNPNDVVIGGHYRVTVSADGKNVKSVDALSRSFLVVNKKAGVPSGATPGFLWMIHLVSPTPIETHVYLSLVHQTPLYVGTADRSIWKVEGGKISKVREGR